MPKIYVFAACEKIIVDQLGTASLISLFNRITATLVSGQEKIPPDAVVPKEWTIFTSWIVEPGDEGKEYVECIQVLYPDGKIFKENKDSKFNMVPGKRSQVAIQMVGFPIGQAGPYTVKMWLEQNNIQVSKTESFELDVVLLTGNNDAKQTNL